MVAVGNKFPLTWNALPWREAPYHSRNCKGKVHEDSGTEQLIHLRKPLKLTRYPSSALPMVVSEVRTLQRLRPTSQAARDSSICWTACKSCKKSQGSSLSELSPVLGWAFCNAATEWCYWEVRKRWALSERWALGTLSSLCSLPHSLSD